MTDPGAMMSLKRRAGTEVSAMTAPASPAPPGKARIKNCPDCKGTPGRDCPDCEGRGQILWRSCPRCGDPAWDYINGRDDTNGMACRINCGHTWTATDSAWLAQRWPYLAAR